MSGEHQRRYRILSKLADGGYGSVYHARLEGAGGFSKDVAIKLLHEHVTNEKTLARFRDEARLLGVIRDSTVVGVDPPVLLDGRWALVMEFVEGASLATLLQHYPTLPPGVALDVVERLARTLDNIWRQRGPEGRPLHLLHRDIKPANIQITPDGNLRLLDLGIARAEFMAREVTTNTFIGTPGYMAPERLTGEDGPEGDIFSLGIVLHEMIMGRRPPVVTDSQRYVDRLEVDPTTRRVLHLAARMFCLEPGPRPSAREVERKAAEIRLVTPGPYLRDWAESHVPGISTAGADQLCGLVLEENPVTGIFDTAIESDPEEETTARSLFFGAFWLAAAALLLTLGLGAMLTAAVLSFRGDTDAPEAGDDDPEPNIEDVLVPGTNDGEPSGADGGEASDDAAGDDAAGDAEDGGAAADRDPEPTAAPRPRPRPRPRPAPEPDPEPENPVAMLEDLRIRALARQAEIVLVMSDPAAKPLHYLQEDPAAKYPYQYVVTFRGAATGLADTSWTFDRPVDGNVLVSDRSGSLLVAVRTTEPARFAFGGSGPTWTVTVNRR